MDARTLKHFSHPKHLITLQEDVIFGENDVCYGCNKPVVGLPTYTCTDIDCQSFYLHKSCAELPTQITHILMHSPHTLYLESCLPSGSCCDICKRNWEKFSYTCDLCDFYVCHKCATTDEAKRLIHHVGHDKKDHSLTLIQREVLFQCDACGEEGKDSSYKCTSCEFWIHERCASSQATIETPAYHHHPLHLIYTIPDIHRTFFRDCEICNKLVRISYWSYYCQKCTYFVHMKCATSPDKGLIRNEILGDCLDDEPGLLQIPLPSEESLLNLYIDQFNKFQGEGSIISNSSTISSVHADPPRFISHWSHDTHSLELLQFISTTSSSDQTDDYDDDDDKLVLVCDACVLPITAAHPPYYACVICQFFLHLFCATKLPLKLPAGASSSHPEHGLSIKQAKKFFDITDCDACGLETNGFYYHCETCSVNVEIRCAFLPKRIKHKSHKHHPLILLKTNNVCRITKWRIDGLGYGCETCNNFQIHIICLFHPSRSHHRYDPHHLTLKNPPCFYEGVFYCQICEEEANNQVWLYNCDECDQSFHTYCLRRDESVKTGGTIVFRIDNQDHTLSLVFKMSTESDDSPFTCHHCRESYNTCYILECDGCGLLICSVCAEELFGTTIYKSP